MVGELFNIAVNDIDARESPCCWRMFVVIELAVSGTQCTAAFMGHSITF